MNGYTQYFHTFCTGDSTVCTVQNCTLQHKYSTVDQHYSMVHSDTYQATEYCKEYQHSTVLQVQYSKLCTLCNFFIVFDLSIKLIVHVLYTNLYIHNWLHSPNLGTIKCSSVGLLYLVAYPWSKFFTNSLNRISFLNGTYCTNYIVLYTLSIIIQYNSWSASVQYSATIHHSCIVQYPTACSFKILYTVSMVFALWPAYSSTYMYSILYVQQYCTELSTAKMVYIVLQY